MCMSPHEMSSEGIEQEIEWIKDQLDGNPGHFWSNFWSGRLESLEAILKERAENGTYHDDFTDRSGTATARQGRATR